MNKQLTNQIKQLILALLGLMICSCSNPKQNINQFVLHPDFEMEMIAAEPVIFDPVDMEFDDHGDAYVLQMPGYPKGIDQSSIVRLIDENKDGVYEDKILFAENLAQASSFMAYRGGFLVASPPDLLFLKDTDSDGRADERLVYMSGFSNGNLQHNFNGLTYGLDNWIYIANGGNGGSTHWADSDSILPIGGFDFKIKPDAHQFEHSGRSSGGYELAMDSWGNFFGTHNLHHVNMIVFPQQYIDGLTLEPRHTLLNISDHEEKGLARVYPVGEQETRVNHPEQSGYFSGACGITYYGGGSFSEPFEGNIFVNDVVLNLVHRDILEENGSALSAKRARAGVDFLASSDRSFRPVNSTVGPDGALYIVDMYRKVIEHPEWIPDEMEVKMDLDAGKNQGHIYRIKEKNRDLFSFSGPEDAAEAWIQLLDHPNLWQRITAQRIILEKGWDCKNQLREKYSSVKTAQGKLHILYTLRGLEDDIQDLVLAAMDDPAPQVQKHAIKLSEPYLTTNKVLRDRVLAFSNSTNEMLLLQTALTISRLPAEFGPEVLKPISSILERNIADPYIRMACMAAIKDQVLPIAAFLQKDSELLSSEGGVAMVEMLALRISQSGTDNERKALINIFSRDHHSNIIRTILEAYGKSGMVIPEKVKKDWIQLLTNLEKKGELSIISAVWNLRKSLNLPESPKKEVAIKQALAALESDEISEREKIEATKILAFSPASQVDQTLFSLIDTRNSPATQLAALTVLLGFEKPEVVRNLIDKWASLSPTVRRRITDQLIYNPSNHDLLFASLESGKLNLSEFNFDLERRRRLLKSKDENTRKRAEALFSDAGVVQRKAAIERMRPALTLEGNPNSGSKVFEVQCATCHRFGSVGNEVGPDLTEISRKSKETLLHDILDPNAGADPEYINHIVELNDGQVYSGIISEETNDALFIKMMGGQEKNIAKNQIKALSSTGLSLMPEGLEGVLKEKDLADLLAFLQQMPM